MRRCAAKEPGSSTRAEIAVETAELVARIEDKKDLSADDEKALGEAIKDWKKTEVV